MSKTKAKPIDADDKQPVLSGAITEIPRHKQPPLQSTVPGYAAIRISGLTYLVATGAVEAFKANHGRQPHDDEGFDAAKPAS